MKIVGVTGTNGAGKGEIVEYFKKKGFTHFSVRTFLIDEIKKRGLPIDRDQKLFVANDLRKKGGASYIIEQLYHEARRMGKDAVIESVRALGEVEFLSKQKDFSLIAVDADPQTRYERIRLRGSTTDNVSFEKFISQQQAEMFSDDPSQPNLSQCIKRADFLITNDGTIEDLHRKLDSLFQKV